MFPTEFRTYVLYALHLQIDSGAVKQISGLGVGVSTMNDHDDDLADHLKTIFDWCKEGNVVQVEAFLTNRKSESVDINQTDENVRCLVKPPTSVT